MPEDDIEMLGPEMCADDAAQGLSARTEQEPIQVRPIQIGKFLTRWVSHRLLLLHKGDIGRSCVP